MTCFLDSSCSNHIIDNVESFSTLEDLIQTDVTFDNHNKVTILGKGTIDILTLKGKQCVTPNVYYVASLKHDLMCPG